MDFDAHRRPAGDQAHRPRAARAARATAERVREHAEAGRYDDALWRELCELGWPGIAVAEEHGGQGLGIVELAILLRGAGLRLRADAVPRERARRRWDRARRLRRAERALAARVSPPARPAARSAARATAPPSWCPTRAGADVVVLVDGAAATAAPSRATRSTAVDAIDSTRRHGRVAARGGGERAAGRRRRGARPRAGRGRRRARRRRPARARDDRSTTSRTASSSACPVGHFQAVSAPGAQMLLDTEGARGDVSSPRGRPTPIRSGSRGRAMAKAAASDAGRDDDGRRRSSSTAASASRGRPTCTGCSSARSSGRASSAAPARTARGSPSWSPPSAAHRLPPDRGGRGARTTGGHRGTATSPARSRSGSTRRSCATELRERARVQLFGEVFNLRPSRAQGLLRAARRRRRAAVLDVARRVRGARAWSPTRWSTARRSSSPAAPTTTPAAARPRRRSPSRSRGLRIAGEGDLLAQLEALRRTLAAEGLFEPQKRAGPPGAAARRSAWSPARAARRATTCSPGCAGAAGPGGWCGRSRRCRTATRRPRITRALQRPGRGRRGRGDRRRARRRLAGRPVRLLRRDPVPHRRAAAHAGDRLGRPPHRPHADRRRRGGLVLDAHPCGRDGGALPRRRGERVACAAPSAALEHHAAPRRARPRPPPGRASRGRLPTHVARQRRALHQSLREIRASARRNRLERRVADANAGRSCCRARPRPAAGAERAARAAHAGRAGLRPGRPRPRARRSSAATRSSTTARATS